MRRLLKRSASRMVPLMAACAILIIQPIPQWVNADPGGTAILSPVQDTWISSNRWQSWGTLETLYVGYSHDVGEMRALVQFDINEIPSTAVIESARLELWYAMCSFSSACASMRASVQRITQEWDEESTWGSMGEASDLRRYDTQTIGGYQERDQWVAWDVTSLVRQWHSGEQSNHGLALHGQVAPPENYKILYAREKGSWAEPRLVVQWANPTPTPTPSPAATVTPMATETPPLTDTPTATITPSPTEPLEPTPTHSPSATATGTLPPTSTATPTVTRTWTGTPTVTATVTSEPTLYAVYLPLILLP